ncbi:discoidin domain-containing protein [Paenibacillus sp. S150]|uniref:discoidin domain-containing protein n=1 Tax=Paenibacillus sp. S150 TaxID=2749826 RepID=UPI001E4DCC6C|nr:discoidin domain-containing protein [Paenibacillus sp. S150]
MKSGQATVFKRAWRRVTAGIAAAGMVIAFMPIAAADTEVQPGTLAAADTENRVEINESVSNGFIHPGVGLTKEVLENMRTQVLAQKEPWYSYYQAMTVSSSAATNVASSNRSAADPTKPDSDAFNSQSFNSKFIADGLKAYTQALMYYITSDEVYRANAMAIIRIWSQMDPAKYVYFTDSHIHTGIPLNRMVAAAEILRYTTPETEALKWTAQDTADFTDNLVNPVIETFQHDNNYFMNQNNYALMGAMAGYIFTDNRERYNEAVEWFTVNKTATDQGFNGSVKQLFRLVDTNAATGEPLDVPHVQHVEMGRDQAHGGGDLTNAAIISRMFLAQGTKVDPVEGTVSADNDAVGPYEFLDDRILAAADYFWQYMLGYDTVFTPVPYAISPDGTVRGIYHYLSDSYRGRMTTANFWDLYYYYTYVKGIDVAQKAPYYYEAFTKRIPSNYYHQGEFKQNWDNVDGGGDFWLYIPQAAEAEGALYLPKEQPGAAFVEIEDRFTDFDQHAAAVQEGSTSYVQIQATAAGSIIAVQNLSYADRTNSRLIGLKIRTNGTAALELGKEKNSTPYHTLALPDTHGEWKYVTYDMGISHVSYGQLDKDYNLLYLKVKGDGTTVDIDHFNVKAGEQLTPPVFQAGAADMDLVAYAYAPVTLDFSATDSAAADAVTYKSSNKPQGAALNAGTGAFSWQPVQSGSYSFIVEASDGTTLATKKVNIVVTNDRASAVEAAIARYNPNTAYVTETLDHYNAVYNETLSQLDSASDAAFYQQLLALGNAVEGLQLLTPLLDDGSMDYSNAVASTFGSSISLLVDNNNNTFPVYTLAPDLSHILDFGADYKITADAFSLQSRMNFVDRMAGSAVFGSNDKENWIRLTPGETPFTDDLARLDVDDAYRNEQFRFIQIQMLHPQPDVLHNVVGNMLELGEFRIFGERHETENKLAAVSLQSDQSINGRIVLGSTVKLTVTAKEALQNVAVTIQGLQAAVSSTDNIHWTAEAVMAGNVPTGAVEFSIDYEANDGTPGDTTYFTTDGSKLHLADESDLISNVTSVADLLDSTSGRTAAATLQQVNYLFDNNPATSSDFRVNGSGAGSYITFDFKAGHQAVLSGIELLARQDTYYGRIKGAVVQGSNDNASWTNLTAAAASTVDWQSFTINSTEPYRYIRIYNSGTWFGNIAELKLHGIVETAD